MLAYAILTFAIAAIGGVILAAHVLRNKFAPWALSLLHALLGAAGLALLIVAALGGFFLASFHLRRKIAPKAVVVVHAGVAVVGFLTLLTLLLY